MLDIFVVSLIIVILETYPLLLTLCLCRNWHTYHFVSQKKYFYSDVFVKPLRTENFYYFLKPVGTGLNNVSRVFKIWTMPPC